MGLTQQQFAVMLGRTQGNVGHYELRDQMVPPDVAQKMIVEAAVRGHRITYEDVYGIVDAPVITKQLLEEALAKADMESNYAKS